MAFHTPAHKLSPHAVVATQISILLAVIITALVSAFVVQTQLQRHHITPEQIPIADLNVWGALGR
jgi:hypothetical protein